MLMLFILIGRSFLLFLGPAISLSLFLDRIGVARETDRRLYAMRVRVDGCELHPSDRIYGGGGIPSASESFLLGSTMSPSNPTRKGIPCSLIRGGRRVEKKVPNPLSLIFLGAFRPPPSSGRFFFPVAPSRH
jgi:hypothetical protein